MRSNSESLTGYAGKYAMRNDPINDIQLYNYNENVRSWSLKYPGTQNDQYNTKSFNYYQQESSSQRGPFEVPPVFCELQVLTKQDDDMEWRETARWIKFEEDVEEGGNRWSKPYVGTISLNSIFQLKTLLTNGTVKLQMDAHSWEAISNIICQNMVNNGMLEFERRDKLRNLLLRPHRHQYELSGMSKLKTDTINDSASTNSSKSLDTNNTITENSNKRFLRKIPPAAEAGNILAGEVDFLQKPISVFIRLIEANIIENLTEVPVPTRFIYILLGPHINQCCYKEIGRAMGTLLCDDIFRDCVYTAEKTEHIVNGIDEFLKDSLILPPAEWDPSIRIEPPARIPIREKKKNSLITSDNSSSNECINECQSLEHQGLLRTGRLFGGLINDIKRKAPWFYSDFKDALNLQCVASWIFLYFACLSPIITFGGLLSEATGRNIAAIESLASGFICGIVYGLFSGQPLALLGSTGPVLVFETIVYDFCQKQGWDYLTFRFWIGTWIALILLLLTAFDSSAAVSYITRFTEENFATLIAFIFILKAFENVVSISEKYPIHNNVNDCICIPPKSDNGNLSSLDFANYGPSSCLKLNGTLSGTGCHGLETENVFLMSILLFLGTFAISVILKDFKNALFFSNFVRQFISDFAVIIAIFVMSSLDYFMDIATPKLEVPNELKPTLPTRGWFIPPFHENNPMWTAFIAIIPAILGTILIFMDQQITAVIINRKENKLNKGCGYHLDLFILSILIQICSVMGLPWFVAATVLSLNHVNSLKKESECSAPGERPQFLGVREQRVTQIMIFSTIGFSVVLTPLLAHIPMPVLFGVFLYMGVASLNGLQFFDRILIMFMPAKYQPSYDYLRQVPIRRVHLFTIIQLACLIALWTIKSFSQTSILFPIMLVVMIGIRKALDFVFTQRELKILDDIMPGMMKQTNEISSVPSAKSAQTAMNSTLA